MIFLDIETAPDLSPGALQRCIDAVEAPGQYKKPESIAEWKATNAEAIGRAEWGRTALSALAGSVYVIGIRIVSNDEIVEKALYRDPRADGQPEGALINEAFAYLATYGSKGGKALDRIIGWNVCGFDLPFLARRCAILNVIPPVRLPLGKRWDSPEVADLMQIWAGGDRQQWVSQRKVAEAMGVAVESDIDGKDLWAAVERDGVKAAAIKCLSDLHALEAIYRRMAAFGLH